MNISDFPNNLRTFRKQKNLTQTDIARSLKCQQATYSRYESGEQWPPLDKVIEIADILEVSIDALVGRDLFCEQAANIEQWVQAMRSLLDAVKEDRRRNIVRVIDGLVHLYQDGLERVKKKDETADN